MPPPDLPLGNLLSEPLFGVVDLHGNRHHLTLPGVLARLADPAATTIGFTALQAHQSHAWHAFLVQLAAMVLHRAGVTDPPTDAAWWGDRLRELGSGEEAWTLAVEDLSKPAFMQPPVPEGGLAAFKNLLESPGAVDLLVTAKNHDRKLEMGDVRDPAAWVYALVSMQTGQGYSGKFNYGVFRMNGGLGSRPGIGILAGFDLGTAFRRDGAVLTEARPAIVARGLFSESGIPLLWCEAWDGTTSRPFTDLDPWTIECCRRVRCRRDPDRLEILMAASARARVKVPEDHTGNVGDPWTPIGRGSRNLGKALTLAATGFTYSRVVDLLTSDWEAPPAQQIRQEDTGDLRWYGRALVRGQGKTEGWHEREIPIPATLRSRFARPEGRQALATVAKDMIDLAATMRLKILKSALTALWEDAEGRIDQALARLEQAVDACFFDHLWAHPDDPTPWRTVLADLARQILDEDCALVGPAANRWQRLSAAEIRFTWHLHHNPKHGPFLPRITHATP